MSRVGDSTRLGDEEGEVTADRVTEDKHERNQPILSNFLRQEVSNKKVGITSQSIDIIHGSITNLHHIILKC